MAFTGRTATSMTTEVLARVRDPNGVQHVAAFVRDRLTDSQRFLNAILGISINTANLTLNAGQNFYLLSTALTSSVRVVGIRGSGATRELAQAPSIDALLIYGPRWARRTSPLVESWTTVGRDVLITYPAVSAQTTLPVYFVNLCTAFSSGATVSEFSVEQCGMIMTLTEALLLLRQRDLEACARAMQRLTVQMAPEMAADRLGVAPTQMKKKAGAA